jgi:capsular polysaccharide biosynthesis protein
MSESGDMIVSGPGGNGKVGRPSTDVFIEPTARERRRRESNDDDGGDDFQMPFDPRRILSILKKRWQLLVKVGAVLGCLLAILGFWRLNYHVSVVLVARDNGTAFVASTEGLSYKPKEYSAADFASLIQQPEILKRAAYNAHPPINEKDLRNRLTVSQDRDAASLLELTLSGKNRQSLVELANLYASNAVYLTKELQLDVAHDQNGFYQKKIVEYDDQLKNINEEIVNFLAANGLSDPENEARTYMGQLGDILTKINDTKMQAKMNALEEVEVRNTMSTDNVSAGTQLQEAREKLATLRAKYTDQHPEVINQLRVIAELQALARPATNAISTNHVASMPDVTSPFYQHSVDLHTKSATFTTQLQELEDQRKEIQDKMANLNVHTTSYNMIKSRLNELMEARKMLASRQHEAQLYEDNAEGYYRIFAPASLNDVDRKARLIKAIMFGFAGFVLGVLGAAGFVIVGEIFDDRLKTVADVERVTKLPVLETLGDLDKMSEAQKEEWAFRAWTALSGQLTISPNHGMVCGFISSVHGEGRSTWVNMLVNAAGQRGLRVLTVATRSTSEPGDLFHAEASAKADEHAFEKAVAAAMSASRAENPNQSKIDPHSLVFPAEISQQLASVNSPPVAHIALPGWVWNLERRKQWQSALTQWRQVDNLVLLVELPPASMPESILLAENLPQLVWLVDSGKARAKETRRQLKTLRHAKCRLVGAVLNHEPKPVFEL